MVEKIPEKEKKFSFLESFFEKPLYKMEKVWYNVLVKGKCPQTYNRRLEECVWIILKELKKSKVSVK